RVQPRCAHPTTKLGKPGWVVRGFRVPIFSSKGGSLMFTSWSPHWQKSGSRGPKRHGPGKKRRLQKVQHAKSRSSVNVEQLEPRNLLSVTGFRSYDGSGTNVANPTWGQAGTALLRVSPVAYADGINSPSLAGNPSARFVSNALSDQTDPANSMEDLDILDSRN